MTIINNVFFGNSEERIRALRHYKGRGDNYLCLIASYCCGDIIKSYGKFGDNYMPISLLSAICEYLERTRNINKTIKQDYDFYTYIYEDKYFVEVETREEVKLPR